MTDAKIYAKAVGELAFDGDSAVLESLDCSYPEVRYPSLIKNTLLGAELLTPVLGATVLTAKGYLLPGNVSVRENHHLLTSIVGAGGSFTLEVGGLTRRVSAKSLTFCSDPGYGTRSGEKFTLVMISPEPCFTAPERTVVGIPDVADGLTFPLSLDASCGTRGSNGTVTVENNGDIETGFVLDIDFPAEAAGFVLVSDREDGTFAITRTIDANEHIKIDTRPGRKSVTDSDGDSILGDLTERCRFHSVKPGTTTFTWRCVSDEAPVVHLTFAEGYLTAEAVG